MTILDNIKIERMILLGQIKINKSDHLKQFCLKYFNLYFDACSRNLQIDNYKYMVQKVTDKYKECNKILSSRKSSPIEKEYLKMCLLELEASNLEKTNCLKLYKNTQINDANCGYVYIVSNKSFADNIYKIGCTKNVPKRINELSKTSIPYDYRLELLIKTALGQQRDMEQYLHSLFDKYRINHKEFFRLGLGEILAKLDENKIEYIRYER